MLHFDFNRAKGAVEEVKQAVEGVKQAMQEVRLGAPPAAFVIPEGVTLEQILGEMMGLMGGESAHQHRMGQLYNHVVAKELAQKAGYKDAPTYFRQKLADLSPASLSKYGAVAKNFSEPVAIRFGVTRLSLLLGYKEAAGLKLNHEEPGSLLIELPGPTGEVTTKPFSACSVDELRKALQLKRKPASSKPVPAEDVALAEVFREALKGHFTQGSNVQVLVRNEKGNSVMDFKSVPVGEVGTLLLALMDHVPPGSELAQGEKVPPAE